MTAETMSAPVETAIVELEREYGVAVEPDGSGGAIVTVSPVDLGPRWSPQSVELIFAIAFNYPFAAIYPFYTEPALSRTDGGAWPSALQRVGWRGREVTQISLRANRWNPSVDTAAGAVAQVAHWFRERA